MEDKKKKNWRRRRKHKSKKTKNKMAVARCTADCLTTIAVHKSKRCGLEIKKEMREKKRRQIVSLWRRRRQRNYLGGVERGTSRFSTSTSPLSFVQKNAFHSRPSSSLIEKKKRVLGWKRRGNRCETGWWSSPRPISSAPHHHHHHHLHQVSSSSCVFCGPSRVREVAVVVASSVVISGGFFVIEAMMMNDR